MYKSLFFYKHNCILRANLILFTCTSLRHKSILSMTVTHDFTCVLQFESLYSDPPSPIPHSPHPSIFISINDYDILTVWKCLYIVPQPSPLLPKPSKNIFVTFFLCREGQGTCMHVCLQQRHSGINRLSTQWHRHQTNINETTSPFI